MALCVSVAVVGSCDYVNDFLIFFESFELILRLNWFKCYIYQVAKLVTYYAAVNESWTCLASALGCTYRIALGSYCVNPAEVWIWTVEYSFCHSVCFRFLYFNDWIVSFSGFSTFQMTSLIILSFALLLTVSICVYLLRVCSFFVTLFLELICCLINCQMQIIFCYFSPKFCFLLMNLLINFEIVIFLL